MTTPPDINEHDIMPCRNSSQPDQRRASGLHDSQSTRMINPSDYDYGTRKEKKSTLVIWIIGGVLLLLGAGAVTYVFLSGKSDKADPDMKYAYDMKEATPAEEPVETDIPAEEAGAYEHRPADGPRVASKAGTPWREGHNVLVGSFSYEGSKYGFTVTMDYSSATGRVSNATYEAHGNGKQAGVSTVVLSNDGSVLYLKGQVAGKALKIDVTAPKGSGTFSGTYVHGSHSGGCTLTIQ